MDGLNLPPRARLVAYVLTSLGSAIVAYLAARGFAGDAEVALWGAVVALVNGMAALNVPTTKRRER